MDRESEQPLDTPGDSNSSPSGTASAPPVKTAAVPPKSAVVGWVLYDLANTIFSMGVISLSLPLWIRGVKGAQEADRYFNIVTAISMAIVFVLSPVLGAVTDRARRRMPFLVVSTLICVALTAILARFGFAITIAAFILANIAYQACTQYYDSLLPEVSTEETRGRIGGIGVGVGYLGSFIAVGLSRMVPPHHEALLFLLYGIAFLLFAIPCMLLVKERGNPNPQPIHWAAIRGSLRETWATLQSSQRYPGLLRFLVGRVFYTDAINTVIGVMALFVANVAVSSGRDEHSAEGQASLILTVAIGFAVVGGFVWGQLNDRWGPKRTLNAVLSGWLIILTLAAAVGIFGLPLFMMYVVASLAGFCLGGVWAADRPYMLRLTPPARVGEFYGLYGMVGRFSAISGPLVWAAVTTLVIRWQSHGVQASSPAQEAAWARVAQGSASLVLLIMIGTGMWILRGVSDAPRTWSEEDSKSRSGS